ncbi:MAG TPA: ATP-binding protein [Candidatus Dormibacteraeota bacterium]|nr:ATP-binding protein [Candidatus Dormibacteraeota bacterium]
MRYAAADVRKQFFIDMFTRDISLEECVLDLIDNSIDSYLQKHSVSVSKLVFEPETANVGKGVGTVEVTCNEHQIKVVDTCGGISRHRAQDEVFCFGHSAGEELGKLGAYGVGMKRALFKIGNNFRIVSRTAEEGFEVSFKLDEWAEKSEWKVPITFIEGTGSERRAGTAITITELRPEVELRIKEGDVPKNIFEDASNTYPYFLGNCVRLRINDDDVDPKPINLGELNGVLRAANEKFEHDGVKVKLAATVAPGQRTSEDAGWYVLCNGRVVVRADKTNLTGWSRDFASFQPKYRSFIGVASFESDNPLNLPWTTTKRDLNRESTSFIKARALMATMTRPILTFLNSQYPAESTTEVADIRDTVGNVKAISFNDVAAKPSTGFLYTPPKRKEKKFEWVRFQAEVRLLDKVRQRLRRSSMGAAEIGRHVLDHFVKTECEE